MLDGCAVVILRLPIVQHDVNMLASPDIAQHTITNAGGGRNGVSDTYLGQLN